MKPKLNILFTILICLICIGVNLFYVFNSDFNLELLIKTNITIIVLLILVALLPAIQQRIRK